MRAGGGIMRVGGPPTLTVNLIWDKSVIDSAPEPFKSAVVAAVASIASRVVSPLAIDINVGFGFTGGSPTTIGNPMPGNLLGGSAYNNATPTYAQVRAALIAKATSVNAIRATSAVPASTPFGSGAANIPAPQAFALGLTGSPGPQNAWMGFSSSANFLYGGGVPAANQWDFNAVVQHELTECMGRSTFAAAAFIWTTVDLFRFSANGVLQTGSSTATPSYFSADNGATNLRNFNSTGSGDPGDWSGVDGVDPYNSSATIGVNSILSSADYIIMDVLGWPSQ